MSQDLLWAPDGKYFTAKTWCHFIQFCLHIMWRLNDSITAGMYGRTVVQQETKLSGQGRTISTSTSANCVMTTKSAKTLCHCIKLCLYIIRMLNNYLIEVYNVDSIHNGPIFEPQNYAQRPQNEYLSTHLFRFSNGNQSPPNLVPLHPVLYISWGGYMILW